MDVESRGHGVGQGNSCGLVQGWVVVGGQSSACVIGAARIFVQFLCKWGKGNLAPQGQRGARTSSEPWQEEQGQAATPWLPEVIK